MTIRRAVLAPMFTVLSLARMDAATHAPPGDPGRRSVEAVLPFASGQAYSLLQGNNGRWGHTGHAAYAFDFRMPIGTEVVAARSGTVVAVEQRYEDGNRKPGQENFVVVRHADGTYARYYHLTKNGSRVAVGASVREGDAIARSGNTGASAGPHLHFDVSRDCYEWGCQTVPVSFRDVEGRQLVEGADYVARSPSADRPEDAAQAAAESWLKAVDAGQYEASWDGAAKLFKGAVTKDQWKQAATGVRGPLGKLVSRKVKSREYAEKVPGAPDGRYVIIQFDTVFANKSSAVETVTPMLDPDGSWRVSGYFIR